MSYSFEEILARSQRIRHGELKRFLRHAASALESGTNRLIRGATAPIEAVRVPAMLAQPLGPEDRPGC